MQKKTAIITAGAGLAAAAALALTGASLANAASPAQSVAQSGYGQAPSGERPAQGGDNKSNGNTDPSKPMRSDEKLLTGDVAAKVTAAAKAKEPNATIERVETDSDGVYEAHMVRADGTHITVQINKEYAVTNVQVGGASGTSGNGGKGGQPPTGVGESNSS